MDKNLKKIVIIFFFILAYIAGCLFPIKNIMPVIKPNGAEVTEYQMYSLGIDAILALITFLTMVVALLKEDIVGLWRKPVLVIEHDERLLTEKRGEDSNNSTAESYDIEFYLKNQGKIDAKNIKATITEIVFINQLSGTTSHIPISEKNIYLDEKDSQILSRFSPLKITLASLKCKQIQSNTSTQSNNIKENVLTIGSNAIEEKYHEGQIKVTIRFSCDGHVIVKVLKIKWDKVWCDRIDDMSPDHLEIELEEGKK